MMNGKTESNDTQSRSRNGGAYGRRPEGDSSLVVDQLQKMPGLLARGVLYATLGFVAAALAYCTFSRVDMVVECPAVVMPRQTFALATSAAADLHVDIVIPNRDAGFVVEGMPVRYKFDAFPYIECGTLSGKVLDVAQAGVEKPGVGYVFHARGSLERTYYEKAGRRYPLKAGMTGTAQLVKGKSSILSILLGRK